jgi:hypothetical protein
MFANGGVLNIQEKNCRRPAQTSDFFAHGIEMQRPATRAVKAFTIPRVI